MTQGIYRFIKDILKVLRISISKKSKFNGENRIQIVLNTV